MDIEHTASSISNADGFFPESHVDMEVDWSAAETRLDTTRETPATTAGTRLSKRILFCLVAVAAIAEARRKQVAKMASCATKLPQRKTNPKASSL